MTIKFDKIVFLFFLVQSFLIAAHNSLKFKKLTILTCPIGSNAFQSGGPQSVTRSLLCGLKKMGINFNYNPRSIHEIGDCLYVLADANALKQGIELRKKGIIKKLVAGPNIFTRANECNHLLAAREIDTYIVNSEWTYQAYLEDEPTLCDRLKIWAAGVDTSFWNPERDLLSTKLNVACKKILIYWKTESQIFCNEVKNLIVEAGFEPIIVKYGKYNAEQFKDLLRQCICSVFISRTESQGIALVEAWAMDVPTLVWDPQEPFAMAGKTYWPIAAAPYISEKNGILWKNYNELQSILANLFEFIRLKNPRKWVINQMSDEVCAMNLLNIINS